MRDTFRALVLALGCIGQGTLAQGNDVDDVNFLYREDGASCIFQTASFDRVVSGPPQDYLPLDVQFELEEVVGDAGLPRDDIDMVQLSYSMCGGDGRTITEYFDRVSIGLFLKDRYTLAPEAVEAFERAWTQLSAIPCDQSEREWMIMRGEGDFCTSLSHNL